MRSGDGSTEIDDIHDYYQRILPYAGGCSPGGEHLLAAENVGSRSVSIKASRGINVQRGNGPSGCRCGSLPQRSADRVFSASQFGESIQR